MKTLNLESIFKIENFGSFWSLVRVSAWVLRFVAKLKARVATRHSRPSHPMHTRSKTQQVNQDRPVVVLQPKEIKSAQMLWLKSVQIHAFPEMFTAKIRQNNLANSLKVEVSDDGLLRCGGRLGEADISPEAKYPILLPSSSAFTRLVVHTSHKLLLHAGVTHTLNHIRTKFWIPQGRRVVSRVLHKCVHCAKFHAKRFAHPPMPNLPKERVIKDVPFSTTGVDYFGPLYCKGLGKGDNAQCKVWVVLFTCFTIRAVHLELVVDMTCENFVCAFRRFVAQKGKPKIILSDNGSQFKMAQKVLKQAENSEIVVENLEGLASEIKSGIVWKFIPEVAPWMGGVYERLVGVVKSALKKSLGRSCLNYEQLRTVLVEVENIVNSRPLTYVNMSTSDIDFEVLTPQKFLSVGRNENLPILSETEPSDLDFEPKVTTRSVLIQNWKIGQYYLNKFWELWSNAYLLGLRERHTHDKFPKVKSEVFRAPKIDEVVLVKRANMPRNLWKLGRIVALIKSTDNLVRSAKLKMAGCKELITRPVTLLFPLEIQDSELSNISDLACEASLGIYDTEITAHISKQPASTLNKVEHKPFASCRNCVFKVSSLLLLLLAVLCVFPCCIAHVPNLQLINMCDFDYSRFERLRMADADNDILDIEPEEDQLDDVRYLYGESPEDDGSTVNQDDQREEGEIEETGDHDQPTDLRDFISRPNYHRLFCRFCNQWRPNRVQRCLCRDAQPSGSTSHGSFRSRSRGFYHSASRRAGHTSTWHNNNTRRGASSNRRAWSNHGSRPLNYHPRRSFRNGPSTSRQGYGRIAHRGSRNMQPSRRSFRRSYVNRGVSRSLERYVSQPEPALPRSIQALNVAASGGHVHIYVGNR